jgi:hypothetical protein
VLLGVFFIAMLNLKPAGLVPEERRVSRWVEKLARRPAPPRTEEKLKPSG